MKATLTPIVAAVAALVGTAAELQSLGAVRPDHADRFAGFRVGLDQVSEAISAALDQAEKGEPSNPDAAALLQLSERVETLALTVDHLADKVEALAPVAA